MDEPTKPNAEETTPDDLRQQLRRNHSETIARLDGLRELLVWVVILFALLYVVRRPRG